MATIGLIVSTVGADPVNGVPRMTFENVNFIGGIEFVSLVLGTLAPPRVLEIVETLRTEKGSTRRWCRVSGTGDQVSSFPTEKTC